MELPENFLKLRHSKSADDRRDALVMLREHLSLEPLDVAAWFDLASCHDFLGETIEAESAYRKVHSIGHGKLPLDKQKKFYLQFGSTLRNNSKPEFAIKVLEEGLRKFPDYLPLRPFLALAYFNAGRFDEAARALFTTTAKLAEGKLDGYETAYKWYVENLDAFPSKDLLD